MIRPARREDLDALVDLETRSFAADRLSRQDFRRRLASPRSVLLVEAEANHLRGYVLVKFEPRRRRAHLQSIASHPETRRSGIGRALLAAAEQAARAVGMAEIELEIREDNLPALGLYRSQGYLPCGRYLGYYEDRADAQRLRKPLTEA